MSTLKENAECKFNECPHKVSYSINEFNYNEMNLSFKGDIMHQKESVGARRITCEQRESLKQYFVDNRAALPSEKHREDLMNVDSESYGAGNLTGPGKSHMGFECQVLLFVQ